MITEQSQFVGELNTILRQECGSDELLQSFIDKYEPMILREVVGTSFYNLIKLAVANPPLTSEMNTLINGGDYAVNMVTYHFRGLKWITAGFIFYWYHRNNAINVESTGASYPNLDNSHNATMSFKVMSAWNEATELIGFRNRKEGTLNHFLTNSDFTGYEVKDYKGGKIRGLQWL